ncbi:MAG TPA: HEAT repeat domain-containing protein [Thermoanaerobaculia bacterium]|nr:HEAT repeat domain-containing protein [Thermoanaerobaculia bacterium]
MSTRRVWLFLCALLIVWVPLAFGIGPRPLPSSDAGLADDGPWPASTPALLAKLETDDEWHREATVEECARRISQGDSDLLSGVLGLLKDQKDPVHRRAAIRVLRWIPEGNLPDDSKLPQTVGEAALERLDDPDVFVRSVAVSVLEWREPPQADALQRIERALREEVSPTIKAKLLLLMARWTAAQGRQAEAENLLARGLSRDMPSAVRIAAIRQLARDRALPSRRLQAILDMLPDLDLEVRLAAINALEFLYGYGNLSLSEPYANEAPKVSAAVAVLLKDQRPSVELAAAKALASLGNRASTQQKALEEAFATSRSEQVRANCALALGAIGQKSKNAQAVTLELVTAIGDGSPSLRVAVISALGRIGKPATGAVDSLRSILRESNGEKVRAAAASALGEIRSPKALPELAAVLKDSHQLSTQRAAVEAIGQLGEAAKDAEDDLRPLLLAEDGELVNVTEGALTAIGAQSDATARALAKRLAVDPERPYSDFNLNGALEHICKRNPLAIKLLAATLTDANLQRRAASILVTTAEDLPYEIEKGTISYLTLERILPALRGAASRMRALPEGGRGAAILEATSDKIESKVRPVRTFLQVITSPLFFIPAGYLLALLGVFWFAPLWLLALDETLRPFKVKLPWLGEVGLHSFLFLQYRPRVLDAWVVRHVDVARANFAERTTVRDRVVQVPLPAVLDGNRLTELTSQELAGAFRQEQARILIWGEGGVGKTSLACQLARWAMAEESEERLTKHTMLPVLVEEDLEVQPETEKPEVCAAALLDVVRGQLQSVAGSPEPIPERLFGRLLRQKRVLVIVDHLSEMNEAMRRAVRPESPTFPINALVVTARTESVLGAVAVHKVTPMRIQGDRTASFMEAYLTRRQKRELFKDAEFFEACAHLSRMVGQRNITVLLARLYADRLIDLKEGSSAAEGLPDSIPDLMLSYLNELNRSVSDDRLDEREVQRTATILAWHCLKTTFRPGPAPRDEVVEALGRTGEERLSYLERKLRIAATVGAARNQVRVNLDPLAEYLAGMYLVDRELRSGEDREAFLVRARTLASDAAADISGFLLAVEDSYLARTAGANPGDAFSSALRSLGQPQPLRQAA